MLSREVDPVRATIILVGLAVVIAAALAGFSSSLFAAYPQSDYLVASVSPEIPAVLGDKVTILVTDDKVLPIHDAIVEVRHNGAVLFTTTTNELGVVDFEYPGMITQVTISKEGYRSTLVVIPKVIEKWPFDYSLALVSSVSIAIGAAITLGGLKLVKRRKSKSR